MVQRIAFTIYFLALFLIILPQIAFAVSDPLEILDQFGDQISNRFNDLQKDAAYIQIPHITFSVISPDFLQTIGEQISHFLKPIAKFSLETTALVFETFAKVLHYIVNIF